MTENTLPKKALLLWRIRIFLLGIFLFAICLYFWTTFRWAVSVATVIGLLVLFMLFWYLPRFISSYKITIQESAVVIKSGVFIKSIHVMPFSRMIYTQTFTTPLAKKMGLTAVTLKAARSRIFLPEMTKEDAKAFIHAIGGEK